MKQTSPLHQQYPVVGRPLPVVSNLPLNGIGAFDCCDWVDPETGLDPGFCTKFGHCYFFSCIIGRILTISLKENEVCCKMGTWGIACSILITILYIVALTVPVLQVQALFVIVIAGVLFDLHFKISDQFRKPTRDGCTVCLCSVFCTNCEAARLYHFALQEIHSGSAPTQQQMVTVV
jgi:hypothetical protein